jgi:mono/diheme cytochrome c family protein
MRNPILIALVLLTMGGCTKKEAGGGGGVAPDPVVAQGRNVYAASCTACHNRDPAKDGALGPAVAGSSLELLERRIVHGDYPEGYEPKRKSKVMVALPHLKGEIESLHKYLSSLTAPK